jgi:hypothetical protein
LKSHTIEYINGCIGAPITKIDDSLHSAINMGYLPISLDNPLKEPKTLKTDNRELYNIIKA